MKIYKKSEIQLKDFSEGLYKKEILNTGKVQILFLTIDPGKALEPHDMPSKVIFNVLKGSGIFNFNNTEYPAQQGDILEAETGAQRFWQNNSDIPLELLVIKSLSE